MLTNKSNGERFIRAFDGQTAVTMIHWPHADENDEKTVAWPDWQPEE